MLYILSAVIAILLIGAILLQSQGGGLSPVFGGGGEMYRSKQTIEKLLIVATGILTVLLVALSIALLTLS
jgi:protein translocase SecG subunit